MQKVIILLSTLVLFSGCESKNKGPSTTKELVKSLLKEMVYVEGGSFTMGAFTEKEDILKHLPQNIRDYRNSEEGRNFAFYATDAWPRHKVTLDGFNMAKFETSWAEFDLYTEIEKLPTVSPLMKEREAYFRKPEKAANLGWHQANRYCKWLAKVSGLPFSLPTEAQWEYAATNKGEYIPYGTSTGYYQEGVTIYKHEEKRAVGGMSAKDTKYPPNPLGIYHLADSQAEWTSNWYADYTETDKVNPKGPQTGSKKVSRGASWGGSPQFAPNWGRASYSVYLTDRKMKFKKEILNQKPTREDAKKLSDGVRCVLNLDRAITQKDIDAVK